MKVNLEDIWNSFYTSFLILWFTLTSVVVAPSIQRTLSARFYLIICLFIVLTIIYRHFKSYKNG